MIANGPSAADARRRAVWVVLIGGVAGAVWIAALQYAWPGIEEWVRSDPERSAERARTLMLVTIGLIVLPLGGLALWLWRLGRRATQVFAVILLGAALVIAVLGWRLTRLMADGA